MLTQTLHIIVKNTTAGGVTAFFFNNLDSLKWIALEAFDLSANGGFKDYVPPMNGDGLYFVRFTLKGGGRELASTVVATNQNANLVEKGGNYYVELPD